MQVYETPELLGPSRTQALSLNCEFQNLLSLVCEAVPEFKSYDARKIAVSIGRSRNLSKYGVWAHVVPLRYYGGKKDRRGKHRGLPGSYYYNVEKIEKKFPEALYLMTFMVPKFFRLSFEERLETVVHELYHLHPEFRGDLRRFEKPHVFHGPTPAAFKRRVRELAQKALQYFPELKHHPLLNEGAHFFESKKCFRLEIPKRIFVRDSLLPTVQGNFWDLFKKIVTGGVFFTFVVAGAWAQNSPTSVEVRVTRQGFLLDKPIPQGEKMRSFQGFEVFRAKKFNFDRSWIYVEDNLGVGGWIPKDQITVVKRNPSPPKAPESQKADNAAETTLKDPALVEPGQTAPDPTFEKKKKAAELDEEIDDPFVKEKKILPDEIAIGKVAFSNRIGRMYSRSSSKSERLGRLERDDMVTVLEASPRGKWVKIRLVETGEEGWVPVPWLEEVRPNQTLGKFFEIQPVHMEANLGFATKEHNVGAGLGLHFRARRPVSEGEWVRNLQVGLESNYFYGTSVSVATPNGTRTFKVRFLVTNALVRFIFSPRKTDFAFGPETGLTYQKAFVSSNNIEDTDLANAKVTKNPSYWGLIGGIRGYFGASDTLYLHGGLRGYFMTDSFVSIDAGVGLRF